MVQFLFIILVCHLIIHQSFHAGQNMEIQGLLLMLHKASPTIWADSGKTINFVLLSATFAFMAIQILDGGHGNQLYRQYTHTNRTTHRKCNMFASQVLRTQELYQKFHETHKEKFCTLFGPLKTSPLNLLCHIYAMC